ncbi:MAG: hypothetical protein BMS9Abin25_0688 [Gammaproteobacteria bacterium]|nr:MAG: hypothetical protein BMS9Abin25_0688 [Gammaproteobacteria bacterium]
MQKTAHLKYLPQTLPIILVVALMVTLTPDGYSQMPSGTKKATGTVLGARQGVLRTIPFITLRNRTGSDDAAKYFGGERSTVQAGYCDVSSTPLTTLKAIAEKAPFYIPDDRVKLTAIRELPIEDLWHDMQNISGSLRPVLYTHGFFINFNRGCKRATLFQENLGLAGRMMLFSWPSDGTILNYAQDESDLYWSVDPLKKILTDMIRRFGAGNIDVVAHSLGSRGVFLALVRMAEAKHRNKPLVNQIILLAPDIDAGIFKQYLPGIKSLARKITIYVSGNDNSLALSRKVHGYPRLGESGTHLQGMTEIEIIDISDIPVRYPSGHVYHLYNDIVINDLNQLLNDGKPASQRNNLKQTGENYWRMQPPAPNSRSATD